MRRLPAVLFISTILFIFLSSFSLPVFASISIPIPQKGAYFGILASNTQGAVSNSALSNTISLLDKKTVLQMVGMGDQNSFAVLDSKIQILNDANAQFGTIPLIHANATKRTVKEIATNTINPQDKRTDSDGKIIQPDAFYRKLAQVLKAYGKPVFMRIFSEMNWTSSAENGVPNYHICSNCKDIDTGQIQTPDDLKNAWRRIYTIFRQEGATNVMFVFLVIPHFSGYFSTSDYTTMYPGDNYVDWIGWDVYNFNTRGWNSFSSLVKADYDKMLSHGKPYIIAEFNTVPGSPGQRGVWYKNALASLQTEFPNIKAINFFNVATGNLKLIQDDPDAVTKFKEAIASPYFLSNIVTSTSSPAPKLRDDLDKNGVVNLNDYEIIKKDFGKTGSLPSDLNGDGKVDIIDYSIFFNNYGK